MERRALYAYLRILATNPSIHFAKPIGFRRNSRRRRITLAYTPSVWLEMSPPGQNDNCVFSPNTAPSSEIESRRKKVARLIDCIPYVTYFCEGKAAPVNTITLNDATFEHIPARKFGTRTRESRCKDIAQSSTRGIGRIIGRPKPKLIAIGRARREQRICLIYQCLRGWGWPPFLSRGNITPS